MQQSISAEKIIFDARKEETVSLELSLPEYLPGIAKIIHIEPTFGKCEFRTEGKKAFEDTRLSIRIIYLSDFGGKIKCAVFDESFSYPFREEFTYEGDYESVPTAYISSQVAKPLNGRKIQLKFVLHMSCSAYSQQQIDLYTKDDDKNNIYVLSKEIDYCTNTRICSSSMSANAEIQIEKENPSASEIIFPRAVAHSVRCTCLDGRLKINAKLSLYALYECSADTNRENSDYNVCAGAFSTAEFETEIEDSRINDKSFCFAYIDINSVDCSIEADSDGEGRIITFVIGYSVNANLAENRSCPVVLDAFSTDYSMETKQKRIAVQSQGLPSNSVREMTYTLREDLSGLSEISVSFLTIESVSREHNEGKDFAHARCLLELIGVNSSGELVSENHHIMLHIPLEENEEKSSLFDFYITVSSCNAKIQSGALECTFSFDITGICCQKNIFDVVGEAELITDKEIQRKKGEIIVYYPMADDGIWSVAKKYYVSPDRLKKANKIPDDSDVFDSKILIIP